MKLAPRSFPPSSAALSFEPAIRLLGGLDRGKDQLNADCRARAEPAHASGLDGRTFAKTVKVEDNI
jgi:hypothetical protein